MKRKLSMAMLAFTLMLSACKKEKDETKELVKAQGSVEFLLKDFDNATLQELKKDENGNEWSIQKEKAVKTINLANVQIALSNNKIYITNDNGEIYISREDSPYLKGSNVLHASGPIPLVFKEKEHKLKIDVTLDQYREHSDTTVADHANHRVAGPMDTRCLDYNGIYTDGKNYGHFNWRAYRNFIKSDCDYAMGRGHCFLDHVRGGCSANHGGRICSAIIGHSSSYHRH